MSYHHKYNFVSPEPVYAIVREELKSYFDTGAVDDLLFPTYLNKCLDKLGKSSLAIVPVLLYIEDFTSRLPENFHSVREAWFCGETSEQTVAAQSAYYSQANSLTSIQLSPLTINGVNQCDNPICNASDCTGDCLPTVIQAVYKTSVDVCRASVKRHFLLKPGNISFDSSSSYRYNDHPDLYGHHANVVQPESPHSASFDTFDLRDNKFVTTFRHGTVELIMYAHDFDCLGSQMIPDNYRIKEFIELFIKYKMFETLSNQTNDETFNQLMQKTEMYSQKADEAYIMAQMEIQKQDAWTKVRRIKKLKNSLNKYELHSSIRTNRRRY